MLESELSRVLLVRACESSDPDGRFVPHRERERAGRQAAEVGATSGPQAQLADRAARLAPLVEEARPALRAARRVASLRIPLLAVAFVGLIVGVGVDTLGASRRINLLSFPLMGLLAWNLAVFAASALASVGQRIGVRQPRSLGAAASWLRDALAWFVSPNRLWVRVAGSDEQAFQRAASREFFASWTESAGALVGARMRTVLHVAAASLASGIVVGMYVAGFAFAYRASWESTFLGPEAVFDLLTTLFAPAAALLGAGLPAAATIAALEAPGEGDAAPWIHLWAVTVALFIVAPRVVLAMLAIARSRREGARLAIDVDSAYALRVLAPGRGEGRSVEIAPYSYTPPASSVESIRELVLELFGNRARVQVRQPMPYGGAPVFDEGAAGEETGAGRCWVVVFNTAQSPEQEVHGELLETHKQWIESQASNDSLLVLLDEAAYADRMAASESDDARLQERLAERRRSWERVLRECGLTGSFLRGAPTDAVLASARDALWPASTATG